MKQTTEMTLEQMIPQFPPIWAEVFGEDDYGIFAECSLDGVRFVWRWICPGTFMMGSPENEVGRYDDELRHKVTLTRGYWLGETPVRQAQWVAVMGKNPSAFVGEDWRELPVENVNWHDCQDFAAKLNNYFPGLHAALPTEAQWEYACRADQQTAFNDGSACTKPVGKDPALDRLGWFDKNDGGKTHVVKGKTPNAWGLYDMHGNVWEWCADAWVDGAYEKHKDGVVDPFVDLAEESVFRVMRGGSWVSNARGCRSAYRDGGDPVGRWRPQGLRLAAGQEQGGGAAGPENTQVQIIPRTELTHRLSAEQIADAKQRLSLRNAVHQHDDCIRMAYEWLDAQKKTKNARKSFRPLKHLIEKWAGRYVSQSDVEVAAELHPEIHGEYPCFNISSLLTEPSLKRLEGIGEAMKHSYRSDHDPSNYSRHEDAEG